jgi:hypothetical protein
VVILTQQGHDVMHHSCSFSMHHSCSFTAAHPADGGLSVCRACVKRWSRPDSCRNLTDCTAIRALFHSSLLPPPMGGSFVRAGPPSTAIVREIPTFTTAVVKVPSHTAPHKNTPKVSVTQYNLPQHQIVLKCLKLSLHLVSTTGLFGKVKFSSEYGGEQVNLHGYGSKYYYGYSAQNFRFY